MSILWAVQLIVDNPKFIAESTEPSTHATFKAFRTQAEAVAAYNKAVAAGLPPDSKSMMIYLWRTDPHPSRAGRLHTVAKHCHVWTDEDGIHSENG